jgi:hypothetical protein
MTTTDSWTDVMAALEGYADEALVADDTAAEPELPGTWEPPMHLGMLPLSLLERATALLQTQREALGHVDVFRREAGRHLAAVRSVPSNRSAASAVYLDVTG